MTVLKQKIAVMQHFEDGGEVGYYNNNSPAHQHPTKAPIWDWFSHTFYIIHSKPSIDWDHVHEDYKWMATDKNGCAILYEHRPDAVNEVWTNSNVGSEIASPTDFATFKPGTCDWKDSLVERPK